MIRDGHDSGGRSCGKPLQPTITVYPSRLGGLVASKRYLVHSHKQYDYFALTISDATCTI